FRGDGEQLRAAVRWVRAAGHVPELLERRDLAAGDRGVDVQVRGDLAEPLLALPGEQAEHRARPNGHVPGVGAEAGGPRPVDRAQELEQLVGGGRGDHEVLQLVATSNYTELVGLYN